MPRVTIAELRELLPFLTEEDVKPLRKLLYNNISIEEAVAEAMRAPNMVEVMRETPLRVLVSGEDINSLSDGTDVFSGPSRGTVLDFLGASGYRDEYNRNVMRVRPAGGGADCMFDYLVSTCWATEVAAGRGVEGQTFITASGCTFIMYSTITGAMTAIDALSTNDSSTVFICRGTYAETFTVPSAQGSFVNIVGSGMGNTIVRPASGAGPVIAFQAQTAHDNIITIQDLTVDASAMSAGADCIDPAAAGHYNLYRVWFETNAIGSGLIASALSTGRSSVDKCVFTGGGTGIDPSNDATNLLVTDCEFYADLAVGVEISPASGIDQHMTLKGNWFLSSIGVAFRSNGSSDVLMNGNHFFNCIDGVLFEDATGGIRWNSILINDNDFFACTDAIDMDSANGTIAIQIEDNAFTSAGAADVAIRGDLTRVAGSLIIGNTFENYTANNEMVDLDETTNEIAHNITDSGATLPDSHGITAAFDHQHTATGDGGGTIQPDVFKFPAATELTIASGAITITQSHHTVATEGGASADDLTTIDGFLDNQLLILRNVNGSGDVVTLTQASNIEIPYGESIKLGADDSDYALLWYNPDRDVWIAVAMGTVPFLSSAGTAAISSASDVLLFTGGFQFNATGVTIASGKIVELTNPNPLLRITNEGAAASDDLDSIDVGTDISFLIIMPASATQTVVLKHNAAGGTAGKRLFTQGGADISLAELEDYALLIRHPTLDSGNGGWMVFAANSLTAHIADTTDAHDASAISIADAGGYFTATEVEAALQEIMADGHELTITVESPTGAENIVMRQFTQAVTIVAIQAICVGGTSVTIDPEHGSTITTATKLLSAPEVVAASNTSGEHIGGTGAAMAATFNDVTLAAGDFLRLETTAVSGTPAQLSVTIRYRLL